MGIFTMNNLHAWREVVIILTCSIWNTWTTRLRKHPQAIQTNPKAVPIQPALHFLVFYTWKEDLKMQTKVAA